MAYKGAKALPDLEKMVEGNSLLYMDKLLEEYKERNLFIPTLTTDDLDVEVERCGLSGSPTKVHNVESVVLASGSHKKIEPTKDGLTQLIDELMNDHIIG